MTRPSTTSNSQRNSGFSLIELMVSLVIGMVIMIAVVSAYIGASGAGRVADAQSRMDEDAQAALNVLAANIRMAGNNPDQPNRVDNANPYASSLRNPLYAAPGSNFTFAFTAPAITSTMPLRGCNTTFSNIASATIIDTLTCPAGTSTTHSIAVSYEADQFNTMASGGVPTDCLGNTVPVGTVTNLPVIVANVSTPSLVTYTKADNRFYIANSAGTPTVPSLYCKGNGSATAQPLVENIESMQFHYGTVLASAQPVTATVAGYLYADELLTEPSLAALTDDYTRWTKVIAVRMCVVVRSEAFVTPDGVTSKYYNCDDPPNLVDSPDLRLRRAYSKTVLLRNRRY